MFQRVALGACAEGPRQSRKRSTWPVSSGGSCSCQVRGHGDLGQCGYDADDEKRADSRNIIVRVCIYVLPTKQFTEIYHAVHSFKVYNSRAFSTDKDLCNHHHYLFQNIFIIRRRNPAPLSHHPSISPQPQQPLSCSLSIDWPILHIAYTWSQAICSPLLWLASLT